MKISKKFMSLVLCVAMLVTMMPTVFADSPSISVVAKEEAVNLTLSADAFNANGSATERVTLTDATSAEVATGNYALHMSNSTSKYQKSFASPYADVSGGQFSISYDLYVNSFTPTTLASNTFFSIGGKNDAMSTATSKSQWMINFSPFRVGKGVTDSIVLGDSGINLPNENWYHVVHYFDAYSGCRTDYVIDENGKIMSRSSNEGYGIKDIQYFSITSNSAVCGNYYLDNIMLKDESIKISSVPESVEASESVSFNVTLPEGFEAAVVLADGETIGNISPVTGKNSYDVTIPAGVLSAGNREIMITASYSDGRTISTKADILIVKDNILGLNKDNGTAISTEVQTFDSLYNSATVADDGTISISYTAIQASGWMSGDAGLLMPGPSGKDGDYALLTLNSTNGRLLQLVGISNGPAATEGIVVFEFDLWVSSAATDLRFYPYGTTGSTFMDDNTILGGATVNGEEWTPIRLVYSIAEQVAEVTVGTTTFTYARKMNFSTNFRIQTNNGTIFAIDNARVYNVVDDATVTSASYDSTAITNKTIPATAKTLNLTLSDKALAPALADIELYADGTKIDVTNVSTTDGVVSITLPALKANTDLDVVIKNTVAGLGNDIKENFYVTDASGYFFKPVGVIKAGAKLIGTVRHFGNAGFTPVLASYNSSELTSVTAISYHYANSSSHHAKLFGHSAYTMVITPSSADSAKIMALSGLSLATPKMTAASYNIN